MNVARGLYPRAVGKLADFAVCSDNMLTCDPLTIKDIKVLRTVIGGRTVYEA